MNGNIIEITTLPLHNLRNKCIVERNKNEPAKKHDIVQVKNPKTDRYIKIDRTEGTIISNKKTPGPYKGIPIARKRK